MKNRFFHKGIIYTAIVFISIIFLLFTIKLVCINDCRSIREEYLRVMAEYSADKINSALDTGIKLEDYYGVKYICANTASDDIKSLGCVVLNSEGIPLEYSFEGAENQTELLSCIFSDEFEAVLKSQKTDFSDIGGQRLLAVTLAEGAGSFVLLYEKAELSYFEGYDIVRQYKAAVERSAELMLDVLSKDVSSLAERGLSARDILMLEDYYRASLSNVHIAALKSFTSVPPVKDEGELSAQAADGIYICMSLNDQYISQLYLQMLLTAVAAIAVCIVIILEFSMLGKIGGARLTVANAQYGALMPSVIRFFTFFVYLAVYASLPYGAIIIREYGESVGGIYSGLLAAFPVSLFCIGIIAAQLFGSRLLNFLGFKKYIVLMLAFGVLPSSMCAVNTSALHILFCSFGLGVCAGCERYLMNNIIPLCADTDTQVSRGYGFFNAGLLSGLTFGGSLGGVVAQVWGFNSVYKVSAILLSAVALLFLTCMPFDYLYGRQNGGTQALQSSRWAELLCLMRDKPALTAGLFVSCVPLNLGLMFIVSFLPVFVGNSNLPSLTNSYAYLLYGVAGSYFGLILLRLLGGVRERVNAFYGMLLIALSVTVLMLSHTLGAIMLSVLLAGLFDGFGSAAVTGSFVNADYSKGIDKSLLLTASSLVGGIVSSASSFIYGFIIDRGNISINLMCLAVFFLLSGILILKRR